MRKQDTNFMEVSKKMKGINGKEEQWEDFKELIK